MTIETLERAKIIEKKMDELKREITSLNTMIDMSDGEHALRIYLAVDTKSGSRYAQFEKTGRDNEIYQGLILHTIKNVKELLEHQLDELADELEEL